MSPITANKVSNKNRFTMLPQYFGRFAMRAENYTYDALRNMCPTYQGGYWEFFELSDKGFYMAPEGHETMLIEVLGNGFSGEVSADAAGIIATLCTFNALSWSTRQDKFIESFYLLREFALNHAENGEILAAID